MHSRNLKLEPIPMGESLLEKITIELVGELEECEGFNAILVITHRFIKIQYYIPAKTT